MGSACNCQVDTAGPLQGHLPVVLGHQLLPASACLSSALALAELVPEMTLTSGHGWRALRDHLRSVPSKLPEGLREI